MTNHTQSWRAASSISRAFSNANAYFKNQGRLIRRPLRISQDLKVLEAEGFHKIVVVNGYPKSGNTWLTRLLSDVLNCPSRGHLPGLDATEPAVEGLERSSTTAILKSHEPSDFVVPHHRSLDIQYVHIIRDPRDVAVSLAAYSFSDLFKERPTEAIDRAIAVLLNNGIRSHWRQRGWRKFVAGFKDINCAEARYESFWDDTPGALQKLLLQLGIDVSPHKIQQSVEKQSFNRRKNEFIRKNDTTKANFLRRGGYGHFREELSCDQIRLIEAQLDDAMAQWGYL